MILLAAAIYSGVIKHCTKPPAAVVLTVASSAVHQLIELYHNINLDASKEKTAETIPAEALFVVPQSIISLFLILESLDY